jgi:fumarate reductase (CoM/CoB) subunit A
VVLATGGAAALYERHDNPQRMMGEGYALALEAGAVLTDMEFVQFFPIGLAEPGLPQMLIPPVLAARGEIVNERGEDLVEKYEIRERPAVLRARDALSQALIREMKTGQSVRLDLRRLRGDEWRDEQGSTFMRETLGERYGALHRPVRIAPMAHHTMGGIVIDTWGSSGVPGFFAAGEAAGGLHGANRMGGNALADTIVFGARAGRRAAEWAREHRSGPRKLREDMSRFAPASEGASPAGAAVDFKKKLRKIMWEDVGVVRSGEGLRGALRELGRLEEDISCPSGAGDSRRVRDWMELRLGICTARVIAEAALRREESRGAHFREDFPRSDDARWLGHIEVRRDERGNFGYSFNAL